MTQEDIQFVLENINSRLTLDKPLTPDDIVSTRCGVRPLAVKAEKGQKRDFLQLSRKHVIDTHEESAHISIFGGKLTDCLNVGEEIADELTKLGVDLSAPKTVWYGEPGDDVKASFMQKAADMELDTLTPATSTEQLSSRLWRRYGADAFELLDKIKADPTEAEVLIEKTEYIRCELEHARDHEMITELEDFLRRRAKVSLVVHRDELEHSEGLKKACEVLFGDQAEERFNTYFAENPDTTRPMAELAK